jgi:hypothetical protein
VVGKDGKSYGAKKQKLCDRCARIGVGVKDCQACAELKKSRGGRRKKTEGEANGKPTENKEADSKAIFDKEGHLLTPACEEAFATLAKFEEMDDNCRKLQKLIDEVAKIKGGEQLARFVRSNKTGDNIIYKHDSLNDLKASLKINRPHSICPWCAGEAKSGCKGCSGSGWVTKVTWSNSDDATKGRIKCSA